ncbi:MAG: homoserine O-succinyltransferase [Thermoanaerobaculia bacterium]|nr:homoserine O-succinyltransferase [Thermoanaerobaculia bacterium]
MTSVAGFAGRAEGSSPPSSTAKPGLRVERGILPLDESQRLHHGGRWPVGSTPALAWERVSSASGSPHPKPTVVVLGGISAGRHVCDTDQTGWWNSVVGPGGAVDSDRFAILGIDFVGGNGASIGPRQAEGGSRVGDWPAVDPRDQSSALVALLDALRIDRVASFIGASYGGAVALAFGEAFPTRVGQLIVLSSAERSHPQTTAYRSLQRGVVRDALSQGDGAAGLRRARGLAMVGYRTADEFLARFSARPIREDGRFRFAVEEYLEARGRDFALRFDPQAFLVLSESLDLHDVVPEKVVVPTHLVAVESDQIVPLEQMVSLRERLGGPCSLHTLQSLYGHDAFLKESVQIGRILTRCLEEI